MGNVVALSAYELKRSSERENRTGRGTAEVILFTGVRYERMGNREGSLKLKAKGAFSNLGLPASSKS